MAAVTPAHTGVAVTVIASLGRHAARVLRDPEFQAVVKHDGWQFVVRVASEARAAWLRT